MNIKMVGIMLSLLVCSVPVEAKKYQTKPSKQSSGLSRHYAIQNEFLRIEKSVGINTPRNTVNHTKRVSGKQGKQHQFDKARGELNKLLQATPLDVKKIQVQINELQSLNPARWPRPDDYIRVLDKKMALAIPPLT